MRKTIIILTLCFFTGYQLISCKDPKPGNLLPEIAQSDSIAVLYYKTPGNPRFFSYVKINDVRQLDPLVQDINGVVLPGEKECDTEGKIHFYKGTEEVYTVYFTRNQGCQTFSIIKTGEKYFVAMSKEALKIINDLQAAAVEPVAQQ